MWLTIGISGVSCSGKTTLANGVRDRLLTANRVQPDRVHIIHQDSYFYPIDSPHHIWIRDLRHINRERLGALDTAQLLADIRATVSDHSASSATSASTPEEGRPNILIVEGHLIFNHAEINALFDVRLCLDVPFDVCRERRAGRRYPQPTPVGYFERFVWPLYREHFSAFTSSGPSSLASADDDDHHDDNNINHEGSSGDGHNRIRTAATKVHVLSGGDLAGDDARQRCLDEAMHAILEKL